MVAKSVPSSASRNLQEVGLRTERAASDNLGGLIEVAEILNQAGVSFWLDSGVLLGLVRSGRMNSWEKDIDFGAWPSALPAIEAATDDFVRAGYKVQYSRYKNIPYTITFSPNCKKTESRLKLSIHIYYKVSNYLWSPQIQMYVPPPAPDILSEYEGDFIGSIIKNRLTYWFSNNQVGDLNEQFRKRSIFYKILRSIYNRIDNKKLAEIWPTNQVIVPLTWLIPIALVTPLTKMEVWGTSVHVPGNCFEYLKYRYGDWRIPRREWWYWRDDGAIVRRDPYDVLIEVGGRIEEIRALCAERKVNLAGEQP